MLMGIIETFKSVLVTGFDIYLQLYWRKPNPFLKNALELFLYDNEMQKVGNMFPLILWPNWWNLTEIAIPMIILTLYYALNYTVNWFFS